MGNNIKTGKRGESFAKDYLVAKSYNILNMNFRNYIGEIDIIAMDKDVLVFIEVKTRTSMKFGYAYESVNYRKQQKIINASLSYIQQRNIRNTQIRYDIIEVYLTPNVNINHIENAFCWE